MGKGQPISRHWTLFNGHTLTILSMTEVPHGQDQTIIDKGHTHGENLKVYFLWCAHFVWFTYSAQAFFARFRQG
jgi:hypothetical protein